MNGFHMRPRAGTVAEACTTCKHPLLCIAVSTNSIHMVSRRDHTDWCKCLRRCTAPALMECSDFPDTGECRRQYRSNVNGSYPGLLRHQRLNPGTSQQSGVETLLLATGTVSRLLEHPLPAFLRDMSACTTRVLYLTRDSPCNTKELQSAVHSLPYFQPDGGDVAAEAN